MPQSLNVLIAEDDEHDVALCLEQLEAAGFDPAYQRVDTAQGFVAALESQAWDVVICDYAMPGFDAMAALRLLQESGLEIPFIVVTGTINEKTAVECLKRGADNYILKENLARLGPAVKQALKMFDDHRQRHRLEEQLRQAQKLEAVGMLAGGVAHDCHNLMTVITGHTERAKKTLPTDHVALESLGVIEEAVQQAISMTRSLLMFAKKLPVETAPVNLVELTQQSLRLLRRLLPASVEFVVDLPTDEAPWIMGDGSQIQQVLMNLIVNARHAMPDGGRLGVTLEVEPDEAILIVEDTGVGMTKEVLSRVFEPFFTTRHTSEGTGLGLAVVHGIVTGHGGAIDITSQLGQGTRLVVRLPLCQPPQDEKVVPDEHEEHRGDGALVVVAEDNEYVRQLIEITLTSEGYQTLTANDGEEAMRAIQDHHTDVKLVILDLDMPKKPGLVCIKEIRSKYANLPTIVMSGNINRFLDAHPQANERALAKPFRMPEMLDLVQRTLSR